MVPSLRAACRGSLVDLTGTGDTQDICGMLAQALSSTLKRANTSSDQGMTKHSEMPQAASLFSDSGIHLRSLIPMIN